MLYAAASAARSWDEGQVRRLPVPWEPLGRVVRPRGGQHVMTLAAPGVGKTMFLVNWAARAGVPVLYQSADTDATIMSAQLAALATGHLKDDVEARLQSSPQWRRTYTEAIRQAFPHVVLDFTSAPRLDVVAEQAEALCEVWGEPPYLIVLDTASDVQKRGEDYPAWRDAWLAGRDLARFFNCVVMWAHHVNQGPAASGEVAPKQNDGQYKADQFAEIVLGLHRPEGRLLVATVLKNRGGKSKVPVRLVAEYDRAMVREIEEDDEI